MMYYFVPILLKKPIWSHGLSLVGFWGIAFFYPLQGIHHFLYTPIPMFLQYGAVISTIAVELVVATVIFNFHATLRGSTGALATNIPIRWFYTGMFFYFLTCLQCAFQTTLTFQQLIHFSDWVVGHAHMVMFGVFAMWQLGMMTYLIPRLLKTPWYSQRLLEFHFWSSFIGIFVMAADLITLGVFQGLSWASLMPWEHSVDISIPFWAVRAVAGILMILGYLAFVINIIQTYLASRPSPQEAAVAAA
jgi:cytochrome c oxidase cbb3-type subunit 1